MLEELKRCNTIGDRAGILFLLKLVFSDGVCNEKAVKNKSVINPNIRLNPNIALKFLTFLDLIELDEDHFQLTHKGVFLERNYVGNLIDSIGKVVLKKLIDQNIISIDEIRVETRGETIYYEIASFPLSAAIFRNFLFEIDLLEIQNGVYYLQLSHDVESSISRTIRKKRRLVSKQELLNRLEKQSVQGQVAEEWVLEYEKRRLQHSELVSKVKIISDIDVQAGFDIISFNDNTSSHYDRFIEVKSFVGNIHFYWSRNESEVAKIKGDTYFLYIVDFNKINDGLYVPIIIKNPSKVLFENSSWLIETNSFMVRKIVFD